MPLSRIYLSPGLFGFSRIGSFAYFKHVEAALRERFEQAGREVRLHRVEAQPTASIRRRAEMLWAAMACTAQPTDALHLLGHSTGGLDARLLVSPSARLSQPDEIARMRPQVRSVTCMNTPHYGTPLAAFFATVSGQRMLYALSALTVTALSLGAPPLSLISSALAALRPSEALGFESRLVDRAIDRLVRALDEAASRDLRSYLSHLRDDQGGLLQLSPESMDLFQASVDDCPSVLYQCSASYAPAPTWKHWARMTTSPMRTPSAALFAALYRLTGRQHRFYECQPRGEAWQALLIDRLGQVPPPEANDGIVPFRSQLSEGLVWVGQGDHLDVVGHFNGRGVDRDHADWLLSGARFDGARFSSLMDAIAAGMLRAEA